jgi:hypothetical protein
MNSDQYKGWIGDLPKLTTAQIMDLSCRVKLLSQVSVKEHEGKSEVGNRVLQIICSVMKKHRTENPSIIMLKKSTAYISSKDKILDMMSFFENISKSKLVQDAVLKIGIDLLYTDLLQWQGIAVSSHTLLRQIHRVPSVINRHFPGYAQSGLLVKLVKIKE